jgi:two-component system response regulator
MSSGVLPPLMIVDDNEDDVFLVARRLKDAGVENSLLHFRDGAEAFDFLKQFCPPARTSVQLPGVMFLDINMPGLSGFDILLWARKQPALARMKIVVLSGANEEWDAKIAAKLGADDYVPKVPRADELKKLIPVTCLSPAPET